MGWNSYFGLSTRRMKFSIRKRQRRKKEHLVDVGTPYWLWRMKAIKKWGEE